jgi:hypothetical protein
MLKRKLCEARFKWKLTCERPLLIADGRYDQKRDMPDLADGKYPDQIFISRTPHNQIVQQLQQLPPDKLSWNFYVPGTSLREPFRAQAERIIRSLLPENASLPYTACDPLDIDSLID